MHPDCPPGSGCWPTRTRVATPGTGGATDEPRNLLLGLTMLRQRAEHYADLLDRKPGVNAALHIGDGPPAGDGQAKPKVRLVGEDGNAFAILGRCRVAAKQAGWSDEKTAHFIQKILRAADYDGVLAVVTEHFDVE